MQCMYVCVYMYMCMFITGRQCLNRAILTFLFDGNDNNSRSFLGLKAKDTKGRVLDVKVLVPGSGPLKACRVSTSGLDVGLELPEP